MRKRYRSAESGRYVSPETAEANPTGTVSEPATQSDAAAKFLKRVAEDGGAIISSNDLPPEAIAEAREEGRLFVDQEGFGYVYEALD